MWRLVAHGRVQPEIGVELAGERARSEGLDLGVESSAHPADFALGYPGDAQALDEIVDPAGRDAQHVCLLDNREQGSFGSPARFEKRGK
jgi:hypothetical protein